jgi:hypothetical protein
MTRRLLAKPGTGYDFNMSTTKLRREIKKVIDKLPPAKLASLADYALFLGRPTFEERMERARKDIAEGRVVNWRKGRDDV